MEVHDDDQEHLTSVLQGNDGNDEEQLDFMSPTELHVLSRQRYKEAIDQMNDYSRKRSIPAISKETDLSKERYEHLPEYARASFVPDRERLELGSTQLASGMIVPSDPRLLEILKRTATKAASAPQLEVMLKFKQRDNEDFVFLLRDHPWHAYYLHLKDVEDKKLNQTGIGLLGTYSSSDEDDHDNEAVQEAVKYDEPVNTVRLIHPEQAKKVDNDQTGDNDNSDEAAQKARRLKRAKMMKGHYALKLMESSKNSQF